MLTKVTSRLDGRVFEGECPDDVDIVWVVDRFWLGFNGRAEAERLYHAMQRMPWLQDEEDRVTIHRMLAL